MYVDAIHDRKTDHIKIVERINGKRVFQDVPVEHVFYYEHPAGMHQSIFGHPCKKFSHTDGQKVRMELRKRHAEGRRIFESDLNPIFRVLSTQYKGVDAPKLHVGFFDIEVDFDPNKGFAPTDDPFNKITAISVHRSYDQKLITLVLRPPTIAVAEAEAIVAKFEDTILFDDEAEMLDAFLDVIEDIDVLSGWNSEGFDIPYIVNRMKIILSEKALSRLCLWEQKPRAREYIKFQKTFNTYDLVGRVHLDYLLLYQKHNTQQLHSYRLDYVGEIEVGENKIPYEGTLDDLYKKDFEKFIAYNRQDTALLQKIDAKRKFIELSNQLAHANGVLLKTTVGSVALVEQAIINEMHEMGFIVPDRKSTVEERETGVRRSRDDAEEDDEERTPVVGAYVADPKVGLQEHVGCCDINSLYPSALRALNMSPETIIGQVRPEATMALVQKRIAEGVPRAEAWEGLFHLIEVGWMHDGTDDLVTIDYDDGRKSVTMTGAALHDYIFNPKNNLCITANGTIFRTDKDGMIPLLLAKWYANRKTLQAKQKDHESKAKKAVDPKEKAENEYWSGFYDQRQLAQKILLNSLYGALLNEGLRFYDERVGQSVTLTGRSIVRHMNAKINEAITGQYDYKGDGIVYADTDSVAADTLVRTNAGTIMISALFDTSPIKWQVGDKEYATDDRLTVVGYNPETHTSANEKINYVYRHRVRKRRFRITDDTGKSVVVTEDHSIMVLRDGDLIKIKPCDIQVGDNLVTLT